MKSFPVILLFACFATGVSCNNETGYLSKLFFDPYGKKVGDSVFYDNLIQKIVFTDSTYEIDSVVFSRYDNPGKTVKSVNTFMDGKHVFENGETMGKQARLCRRHISTIYCLTNNSSSFRETLFFWCSGFTSTLKPSMKEYC